VHECMFINFHDFNVVQWVSLIFHKSKSYLIIISASMSDIRIMEWTVLTQFGYGEFIGVISFWWAWMYVHQLSWYQCCSVSFLDFPYSKSYLIIISASMSGFRIMEQTVLTQFGYGEVIGVISFDEHECMFINFHDINVVQWVSFIFHKTKSLLYNYFCQHEWH